MDEAGPGTTGSRDSCYICSVPDSAGRVPVTAASYSAADIGSTAAAGHASATDPHAAAAPWIYAACSDSYWGSTAIAFTPAWSACHHFYDSSFIAQWLQSQGLPAT